jgi:hypothetical protein
MFEQWSEGTHMLNDICTDLGVFGWSAVELIGERRKETVSWIVSALYVEQLRSKHTISGYLFLIHAHFDEAWPNDPWLSDHAGKLWGDCMVSHCCSHKSIDVIIWKKGFIKTAASWSK